MNLDTYRGKLCHDLIKKQTDINAFNTLEDVIKLLESLELIRTLT